MRPSSTSTASTHSSTIGSARPESSSSTSFATPDATSASSGALTRDALEKRRGLLGPELRPFVGEAAARDVAGLVGAAAEVDLRPEQHPVRTRAVFVGHADAAGVDEPGAGDAPVELH